MSSPPPWISLFVDRVTSNIHAHDNLSPLGCHFQKIEDVWEITIFASRTEIIGGPQDGSSRESRFSVDVTGVLEEFSMIEKIAWQAHSIGFHDDLGPHFSVEGIVEGNSVWLRITSSAPDKFGPGRRALVNQNKFEDLW